MEEQWSRRELDLHLRIDRAHGLRAGLERALRDAVRDGRLAAGTPLPSSRALARDLGVARGTVTQAYDQLIAEGYLSARQRSGVHVAPQPATRPARTPGMATPFPQLYVPPAAGVDLRPGRPDLSLFPRGPWLAATRKVLQTAPNSAFGNADPTGDAVLKEALAHYLGRARGVVTTPDRIVVCAGFTHALRLICQAVRLDGAAAVAFEDPFPRDYRLLAERAGLDTVHIPVDGDGLEVDRLTGRPAAVVTTPAHQYPLGVTLRPDRRTRLVAWAHRTRGFIVEDDYDGEFRYDRQPVGALQGMAPDRVVYVGTTSKTIGPGLRLGWLVVPDGLFSPLQQVMDGDAAHVSVIDQLVLAHLIRTGEIDRHLRRCRSRYRRRRDLLGAAVARRLPHARLSGIAAGLHAVLQLPGGSAAEPALLHHLAGRGVTVDGLSAYYHRPERSPYGIVIGYAAPPQHGYDHAVNTLIDAVDAA
ncbi:MAG TPA: PLP-dependent aminotransferase family protein [Streptosporangiaceae bacterium]|jgi:GntR family transcriptional regulator/MocR family aminotransferase